MESVIDTWNLNKKYPGKLAVNNVNLHVMRGDIYGFIGKNGAGKTTTMKMLLGLANPTSGQMALFGSTDLNAGRHRIGSLIEAPGIYRQCTAYENLKRLAVLTKSSDAEILELLRIVGLDQTGSRKAGKFSLGMKQRLGIALALLGNPEMLILDEPINGLDPAGIKGIRDILLYLNQQCGVTILISSHLLDELSKITTRYGIINNGWLVEEITAEELAGKCARNLLLRVSDVDGSLKILYENGLLGRYEVRNDAILCYNDPSQVAVMNEKLVLGGIRVHEFRVNEGSYEDYFIERMGR